VAVEKGLLLLKPMAPGPGNAPAGVVGTVRAAMARVMDLGDVGKMIDEFWPAG